MMLNSLMLAPSAAAAAAFATTTTNPHHHYPSHSHQLHSHHHSYPSGHFWMDTAATSSSLMAANTTSTTSPTSTLSPSSFKTEPNEDNHHYQAHHHPHFYPTVALQHCNSLLTQIHLQNASANSVTSSYHEAYRHYSSTQQQQQHLPSMMMIEQHGTSNSSSPSNIFPSLAATSAYPHSFHRLAIVATAKPRSVSHNRARPYRHTHRSQSGKGGSGSSSSGSHKPAETSTAKVGSQLSAPHHPLAHKSTGNGILLGNHQLLPSSHSPSHRRRSSSSSIDRQAKPPLTANELERKRDLANRQERRRMHQLNDALNQLREIIPVDELEYSVFPLNGNRRMSKIKTLRSAISYIRDLENVLKTGGEEEEEKPKIH